jgi:hypothetical protein
MPANYVGIYDANRCDVFRVTDRGRKPLPLRLEVRRYADKLSWGAGGRGAGQLAVALLADAVSRGAALEHAQAFRLEIIERLPADQDWQLSRDQIAAWVKEREAPGELARAAYRDDTCEERDCDYCGRPYRGPAVYCSLECAEADA